jgi:hypothetical protein
MRTRSALIIVAAAATLSSIVTTAVAQTKDALGIADNDSVYIDEKSFKIVPGKAKADTSALIKKLDAKNLGLGTIVLLPTSSPSISCCNSARNGRTSWSRAPLTPPMNS